MFSLIKELLVNPVEYKQFSGRERDIERGKMYELYAKSSREILIVAGELDPKFYNKLFADIVSAKLKKFPDFTVKILFSKDEDLGLREKIEKFHEENPELYELLKEGAFGCRFSVFLSDKRQENHFGIADNSILIEKVHKPRDPRDVLLVENYKALVENYKRYFDKLINDCESTIFPLTSDSFKDKDSAA